MPRIIILLIILLSHLNAFSQKCGGSFNKINFYVLNGSSKATIHYEVLSYDVKDLKDIFSINQINDKKQEKLMSIIYNGIFLSDLYFNQKSLNVGKPFKSLNEAVESDKFASNLNESNKRSGFGPVKLNGIVEKGTLSFPTAEIYHKRFFLKVTCNNHIGLYVMNLFGGCGNELNLIYHKDKGFVESKEAYWLH